jgi:hypothetical protein
MEDELIEKIEDQSKAIQDLEQKLYDQQQRNRRLRARVSAEQSWLILVVTGIMAIVVYPVYMIFTTPDIPTHCIIYRSVCEVTLKGVIPWHTDRSYGQYSSVADALEAAQELGCTVISQQE